MKKTLTVLLLLSTLGLCGLSVAQWLRESKLRAHISDLTRDLQAENKLRVETEEKASSYEREIARISQLRADTEAKLIEVTEELHLTQADQLQRGLSIAVLSNEITAARARAEAAQKLLTEFNAAMEARNTGVTADNNAITEANNRLKQLAAERDKAIAELNARTKAYNELVTPSNKLVK